MLKLSAFMFLLTLASCGLPQLGNDDVITEYRPYDSSGDNNGTGNADSPSSRANQIAKFLKQVQDSFVTRCDKSSECPANVAQFVYVDVTDDGSQLMAQTNLCTASLVAEPRSDLRASVTMALNSHCLPKEIRASGSDCSKNAVFHFANGTNVACDKVVWASTIGDSDEIRSESIRPDVAIVTLKQAPGIAAFPYSRAGLPDGQQMLLYKIDPPENAKVSKVSTLYKDICEPDQSSLMLPDFDSDGFGVGFMINCKIRHGNSGSPLVALDGSMRAVLFGGREDTTGKVPYFLATNMSCLRALNSSTPWDFADPKCPLVVDVVTSSKKAIDDFASSQNRDLVRELTEWSNQASKPLPYLQWTPTFDSASSTIRLLPKCYVASIAPKKSVITSAELPLWNISAATDKRYQLDKRSKRMMVSYAFEINAAANESLGLKIRMRSASELIFDKYIKACD